jgi:hypothetical protein
MKKRTKKERKEGRMGRQKLSGFGFDRSRVRLLAVDPLLAVLVAFLNLFR